VAEQDLAIERGKAALAVASNNQDEIQMLKETITKQDEMLIQVRKDYDALKSESEKNAKKLQELEDWKRKMKMMVDGTSEI
jgi:hypothetical protein